jgi:hypothetical protein
MSAPSKRVWINGGCLLLIIGFFYLIFSPVVFMVRDNSQAVSCQANLKALGIAIYQYSQDNDHVMPNVSGSDGSHTWREAIFPYARVKEIYHCPARNDDLDGNGFSQNYAANDSGGKGALGGPNSLPVLWKEIPSPGKLILLTETENNPRSDFDLDDPVLFGPQTHKLWAGHFQRLDGLLFADGHTKRLPPNATYLDDPKNKSLFNYWYRNDETRLSANGIAVLKDATLRFR